MNRRGIEALFVDGAKGRLFVLLRRSEASSRCVVVVPPFAEEMNRSRRQITATAEALVRQGYSVIVPDLYGTGDSEGEFSDASWSGWLDDIAAVARWAADRGFQVEALLGLRLGCPLAAASLERTGLKVSRSVFWQPVYTGRAQMKQFLRMRVAAQMVGGKAETVSELRERLRTGETLEVAGYRLTPALYAAIDQLKLDTMPKAGLGNLTIIEVGRKPIAPASSTSPADVREPEGACPARHLLGQPFWMSSETIVNPQLIEQTVDCIVQGQHERV